MTDFERPSSWYVECRACPTKVHVVGDLPATVPETDPVFCPGCGRSDITVRRQSPGVDIATGGDQ